MYLHLYIFKQFFSEPFKEFIHEIKVYLEISKNFNIYLVIFNV